MFFFEQGYWQLGDQNIWKNDEQICGHRLSIWKFGESFVKNDQKKTSDTLGEKKTFLPA